MQIDTAGTYLLKYTAEDDCGNVTEVTREVVAELITYRTVLYTDGTFIINEKDSDQAANEALHGVATNVYDPYDPNGSTNIKKYIFTNLLEIPWYSQRTDVKAVKIGSNIKPISTAHWFNGLSTCTSVDVGGLDTSAVTNMSYMFNSCLALTSLDLSSFNTSIVTSTSNMFRDCQALATIYVSSAFIVTQVTSSGGMFTNMSTNLVGGAGTAWNSANPKDKTYAHIDGGTADPGYFTLKSA